MPLDLYHWQPPWTKKQLEEIRISSQNQKSRFLSNSHTQLLHIWFILPTIWIVLMVNVGKYTLPRLIWNLQITHFRKENDLNQTSMMMVHVNLQRCIPYNIIEWTETKEVSSPYITRSRWQLVWTKYI